jgi:ATP-binding cassette subfamily F protein 3
MEPVAEAAEDPSLVFDFPSPKELKPPLLVLEDVAVGYAPDTPVLSGLDLRIDPDDRIAFVGRNGNGKTTLARLLAGQLAPMAGKVAASGKLTVGYFAQHQIEELVAEDTPLQHMERLLPDAKQGAVRAHLGRFGFSGDKAMVQVKKLSGGERARLSLALITRDAPHILILDEPTNHLDVDAREALVQALAAFGGAVVVVSHDRHLLGLIADRLLLVADGTAREFDGSIEDYRDQVLSAGSGKGSNGADASQKISRKDKRKAAADARERAKALRKTATSAEVEMKALWRKRDEIDALLTSPDAAAGELMKRSSTFQKS